MTKLIFANGIAHAKQLSRMCSQGKIKRIRQGIYTDADWGEIPDLLLSKWHEVVNYLYPNAIVSHSSAITLRPINNAVHITADIRGGKKITIGDSLTIHVHPGNVTHQTQPFMPHLFKSAPPRYLLENLQTAHKTGITPKALGQEAVEAELCKVLERQGESEANNIREAARIYSKTFNLAKAFKLLDAIIGALLATRPANMLQTQAALAVAKKEPYDEHRLSLLKGLHNYLQRCHLPGHHYTYEKSNWRNLAFYESYFSNYIEGTEFEIDEAEKIVFEKQEIDSRHADSHDVLSVYEVVHDYTEMSTTPESADELIHILKQRHAIIMDARPEMQPGEFKTKANKAGSTLFVLPEKVEGTLAHAFAYYQELPPGILKAIFMQFLITECHPFNDGNGRLARIMMNAELVASEQQKIIVPTVHRDSYLNGLRQASRSGKFRTITKVFADLQAYTHGIPWSDYGEARATLEAHCADKIPDEGIAVFNKQISKYKTTLPVG